MQAGTNSPGSGEVQGQGMGRFGVQKGRLSSLLSCAFLLGLRMADVEGGRTLCVPFSFISPHDLVTTQRAHAL